MTALIQSHPDAPNCPGCGYDLFGIDSPRCPECGLEVNRQLLSQSHLPWSHREQIGTPRAFRQTFILATFRPRELAREINRPVDARDARRFRLLCVLAAWLPANVGIAWLALRGNLGVDLLAEGFWKSKNTGAFLLGGGVCISGMLWIYFMMLTSLPGLYIPSSLPPQRLARAVALSLYAAAPLAWLWAPLTLLAIFILESRPYSTRMPSRLIVPLSMGLVILGGVQLFAPAIILANLLRRVPESEPVHRWFAYFSLPILSIILFLLIVVAIPMIMLFAMIVWSSFQ